MNTLVLKKEEILDSFHSGREVLLDLAKWANAGMCESIVIEDISYSLQSAIIGRNRVLLNLLRKE